MRSQTPLRRRVLASLAASVRLHVRQPTLVAAALCSATLLFVVGVVSGVEDVSPSELATFVALPPLDLFGGMAVNEGGENRWTLVLLLLVRAASLTFMLHVAFGRLSRAPMLRACLVYLVSYATLAVSVLVTYTYFLVRSNVSGPVTSAVAATLLILQPVMHLFLSVSVGTAAINFMINGRFRPILRDARLWILASLSTWLWMFTSSRADAVHAEHGGGVPFAFAFALVVLQSILLLATAAIVRGSTASDEQCVGQVIAEPIGV